MKLNLKMLAVSTALLGLLAAGACASGLCSRSPERAAALSLPWSAAAVESVDTGTYALHHDGGDAAQLSAGHSARQGRTQSYGNFYVQRQHHRELTSEGVAQAVGVGTAQVIASADGVSCVYTITTELDESMIVKEKDITLGLQHHRCRRDHFPVAGRAALPAHRITPA